MDSRTKPRIKRTYNRSRKRREDRVYNNIIELIEILSRDYLKTKDTLEIASPFSNSIIKIGKFDNTGKKQLQLKVFSSGGDSQTSTHPGTSMPGMSWMEYTTWVHCLDQIDNINRDYLPALNGLGLFSIKINHAKQIKNNNDFEILLNQIDELVEKADEMREEKDEQAAKKCDADASLKKEIVEEVKKSGNLKNILAESIRECLSWVPEETQFQYTSEDEIPDILSTQILIMKSALKLDDPCNSLQPLQARAADLLFFVAVCEDFRVPGAVKYIRSCLKYLIEKNLRFAQVFGSNLHNTICTLSPSGGTKVTRDCIENGNLNELTPPQKEPYEQLSDSSDEEHEEYAVYKLNRA